MVRCGGVGVAGDVGRVAKSRRYSRPTLLRAFFLAGEERRLRFLAAERERERETNSHDYEKWQKERAGEDDDDAINLARLILECCLITL